MSQRKVAVCGAISGALWAAIAIIMMMVMGGSSHVNHIAWSLRGGILAAPLIGIAASAGWPLFRDAGFRGRIAISLAALYAAAFLFMLAAATLPTFLTGVAAASLSSAVFDSWNMAFAGLTWTGFVLILGPLAFLNYWWIAWH